MEQKLAYLKDHGNGTWSAVIVGNIKDGQGEVLDALIERPKAEVDAYVAAQIGQDHVTVYDAPKLQ